MAHNKMMELHQRAFISYWEQWGACILPSDWNWWQSGEDMGAVEAMIPDVFSPTQICSA